MESFPGHPMGPPVNKVTANGWPFPGVTTSPLRGVHPKKKRPE